MNDLFTTSDIYTSATGDDAWPGTNSTQPKCTIQNLIDNTTLLPGDIIYVDAGTYTNPLWLTAGDVGSDNNYIMFIGSTNYKTRLAGKGAGKGIAFRNSKWIKIANFDISNFGYGIDIGQNTKPNSNIFFISNRIHHNITNGIDMTSAWGCMIRDSMSMLNGHRGIDLNSAEVSHNTISNNNIWSNARSDSVSEWACNILIGPRTHKNRIIRNKVHHSPRYGISTYSSTYGMSYSNVIVSNRCYDNTNYGIYLWTTKGNYVGKNTICTNKGDNICLHRGTNNLLVSNIIFKAGLGTDVEGEGISCEYSKLNKIHYNTVFKNPSHGIALNIGCFSNEIAYNVTWSNGSKIGANYGSSLYCGAETTNNFIRRNTVYSNVYHGINLYSTRSNISHNSIVSNTVYQCGAYGICLYGSVNTVVQGNVLYNNDYGIKIGNSSGITLYRNALFRNHWEGIYLQANAMNIRIYNNTIVSNATFSGNNIYLLNGLSGIVLKNNIIAYARSAASYGVASTVAEQPYALKFNCVTNEGNGNYYFCTPGNGSIIAHPFFKSFDPFSFDFLALSNTSPCIGSGTNLGIGFPYIGIAPDMGWKEYSSEYVRISVSKGISNFVSPLGLNKMVPGTLVTYKIRYSIETNIVSGSNIMIVDKLPSFVTYVTDYMAVGTEGWVCEYSTNSIPVFTFDSTHFSSNKPVEKAGIKWVRWKRALSGTQIDKQVIISVVIK